MRYDPDADACNDVTVFISAVVGLSCTLGTLLAPTTGDNIIEPLLAVEVCRDGSIAVPFKAIFKVLVSNLMDPRRFVKLPLLLSPATWSKERFSI